MTMAAHAFPDLADELSRSRPTLPPMTCASAGAFQPRSLPCVFVAVFRNHGHINNVLTHLSGGDWARIEEALRGILDPSSTGAGLSPLARNLVHLLEAEGGVSGRIAKPYFHAQLEALLHPEVAQDVKTRMARLLRQVEATGRHPAAQPTRSVGLLAGRKRDNVLALPSHHLDPVESGSGRTRVTAASRRTSMLTVSSEAARSTDKADRPYLESLIREDFERCHPGETLDDYRRRAAFQKEDRGILRQWMALAAARAAARDDEQGAKVAAIAAE